MQYIIEAKCRTGKVDVKRPVMYNKEKAIEYADNLFLRENITEVTIKQGKTKIYETGSHFAKIWRNGVPNRTQVSQTPAKIFGNHLAQNCTRSSPLPIKSAIGIHRCRFGAYERSEPF